MITALEALTITITLPIRFERIRIKPDSIIHELHLYPCGLWKQEHRWCSSQRVRLECGRSEFESRLGQTKDYKTGICCFFDEDAALRGNLTSKYWLAQNQNNVSEWTCSRHDIAAQLLIRLLAMLFKLEEIFRKYIIHSRNEKDSIYIHLKQHIWIILRQLFQIPNLSV